MLYFILLCFLLPLLILPLPAALQAWGAARQRRRKPAPPPRGCRLVLIQGGKQDVRRPGQNGQARG